MIQRVFEKARGAALVSGVIVATDDQRIMDAVASFGGKAVLTSRDHPSGTDRIAEAAAGIDCDFVVNVQGDEPLIPPENIDLALQPLLRDRSLKVSTLMARIRTAEDIFDPNVVKVVADHRGYALYFSRAPIPYNRDEWSQILEKKGALDFPAYKHIGLYAYTKDFLMEFSRLPASALESIEKLEQLRILENGVRIKVAETDRLSIGVDCPEDISKVERLMGDPAQTRFL
jgi:3-deoxy-manno-octulosonate cytidylyltransferase (CMP-KDO synthetase)